MAYDGSRTVVAARSNDLVRFLSRGGEQVGMKEVHGFLKDITESDITKYTKFAAEMSPQQIFQCEQTRGHIFYLPSGWTYFERIGKADFVGAKLQMSNSK